MLRQKCMYVGWQLHVGEIPALRPEPSQISGVKPAAGSLLIDSGFLGFLPKQMKTY